MILLTYVISQISEKALDLFRMILQGKKLKEQEVRLMDSTKVKEILGKQLELLAEVSEGKPENLAELSAVMCEIADRLEEVRDPLIQPGET